MPALRLEIDEHHRHKDVYQHSLTVLEQACSLETDDDGALPGPDFVLRFAALMHDVGKPATRRFEPNGAVSFRHHDVVGAKLIAKRMKTLRFDNDTIKAVARLVELHMRFYGYGEAGWTDSAVRRYVTDAGPLLERLHRLTRSDVTTRNRRKAERLAFAYDDLERRIAEITRAGAARLRCGRTWTARRSWQILGIKPGPVVGRAYKYLLEWRLDEGPHEEDAAPAELLRWWAEQPEAAAARRLEQAGDRPSASMSMASAAGDLGSPGMVITDRSGPPRTRRRAAARVRAP